MTYKELLDKLNAYAVLYPQFSEQTIFDIRVTDDGDVKLTLQANTIRIKIT